MREIGPVEKSFREVGEGGGLACDLDEYDLYCINCLCGTK